MFKTNFLTNEQITMLAKEHGTPLFVYSRAKLLEQAQSANRRSGWLFGLDERDWLQRFP